MYMYMYVLRLTSNVLALFFPVRRALSVYSETNRDTGSLTIIIIFTLEFIFLIRDVTALISK